MGSSVNPDDVSVSRTVPQVLDQYVQCIYENLILSFVEIFRVFTILKWIPELRTEIIPFSSINL